MEGFWITKWSPKSTKTVKIAKNVGSKRMRVFLVFLETLSMVSETLEPLILMTVSWFLKVFKDASYIDFDGF